MQETQLRSLDQEDPLEKEMTTHSVIFAWRIPWTEEPDGLQSMGSPRVRHNWLHNNNNIYIARSKRCYCPACTHSPRTTAVCHAGSSPLLAPENARGLLLTAGFAWSVRTVRADRSVEKFTWSSPEPVTHGSWWINTSALLPLGFCERCSIHLHT